MFKILKNKDVQNELCIRAFHIGIQELFAVFATMLDSVMLSFVSKTYLSAVSLSLQYITIYLTGIIVSLQFTILLLTPQYYGKKDDSATRKILDTSLAYSLIVSVIFFIITFCFPTEIMSFVTNDKELIINGVEYLKYYAFAILFFAFSKIYLNILKATDAIRWVTIVGIISTATNFLFNFIFIFIFKMGIRGAAIATIIASAVEALICFIHLCKHYKISFNGIINLDPFFRFEILKYAIPIFLWKGVWAIANTVRVSIMGHMDRAYIDSCSFFNLLGNIPASFVTGIGLSFGIILGRELGKGNTKLAREYADDGVKSLFKLACLMAVFTLIINAIGIRVSNVPNGQLHIYIFMAFILAYQYFGAVPVNFFNDGPFTSGGETEFLAFVDNINMWLVIIPIGLITYYVLRLPQWLVLIFIYSHEMTKIIPLYNHYKKYVWARDLTTRELYMPLAGSFIDKYKRNFKLRFNIILTELFTMRFESSTDFIFSISETNYKDVFENFQKYILNLGLVEETTYKLTLAVEEIYHLSKQIFKDRYGEKVFACDVGVKFKDNKVRIIYYDNGLNIEKTLDDETLINVKVIKKLSDKFVYERVLNLNKILIRMNRE